MMRILLSAAAGALIAAAAPAQAVSLIGETLSFHRYYPDTTTAYGVPFTPQTVTVVAGSADNSSWGTYVVFMPEATTITLQIGVPIGMIGAGSVFDGFAVSGFSFAPNQAYIASNTSGPVELSFSGNALYLDFVKNYPAYTYPTGSIVIAFQNPVPEPATWILFAAGLVAVCWPRRHALQSA
ncbi:MAG: hypothetical protein CFE45_13800 [Burkholderiales bacterium PBB5]|nr:MAG: hypothetical protein CFE45_13800 [Burkholderiales bacterium PBB5]